MGATFRTSKRVLDNVIIYDVHGDLTKHAEETMLQLQQWERGLEDGRTILILNLTHVPYINSIGISILIRIVRTLIKAGCQTFVYGVSPHYQKLFGMVGLTEYMMIYPNEFAILQRIESLQLK